MNVPKRDFNIWHRGKRLSKALFDREIRKYFFEFKNWLKEQHRDISGKVVMRDACLNLFVFRKWLLSKGHVQASKRKKHRFI